MQPGVPPEITDRDAEVLKATAYGGRLRLLVAALIVEGLLAFGKSVGTVYRHYVLGEGINRYVILHPRPYECLPIV